LIQIKCLKKINEMKKLIVISYNENYDVGGLVRYIIKMFENDDIRELFKKNDIDIITSHHLKSIIKYEKINTHRCDATVKFIDELDEDEVHNYYMLGIHPYGLNTLIETKRNIKKIAWINDPHYFANYVDRNGETVQDYSQKFNPQILNNIDYLVTPSPIYFKNLNITEYDEKLIYFFYFLNEYFYQMTGNIDYKNRKNKVVLSGCVGGGYLSRIEFDKLRNTEQFKELIYKIDHPGYKDNEHMTELKYYDELTKYKAAFVGHYKFPINFLLAKHIEVLMCGCLGFFEPNTLLETELGLISFEHYIPCFDENNQLIKDENFYKNWMESKEGEKIAENGKSYVREKFGKKYIQELIEFLKTI